MNSCASTTQIVEDYETNGASVGDIAESLELDVVAVRAILESHSLIYKQTEGKPQQDVTEKEHAIFLQAYKSLAFTCESEVVKERILKCLIDEHKGRRDWRKPKGTTVNKTLNVQIINNHLAKARKALGKSLGEETLEGSEKILLLKP